MGEVRASDLIVRRASADDQELILDLLRASLAGAGDPHFEAFQRWKHRENIFGESPAWVAVHGERIVGYRTFLRWRFRTNDDRSVRAVRAVDTATHPDYRGLGVFRRLTLQGVADLTADGDAIVYNTPNDKARAGYLTMGWSIVRRLPIGVLPAGPVRIPRMLTSRVPAALWSEPCSVGYEARDAFTDRGLAETLLEYAPDIGFRTERTPDYLAWRTGFEPLHYRLLLTWPRDPAQGGIIFRLRRRGSALEATVLEQLVPDRITGARLVARVLRETGADYAVGLRTGPSDGLLPVPRQGPVLLVRPLASTPPAASEWTLTLGDIELF